MKKKNIISAARILFDSRLNKKGLKLLPEHLIPNNNKEAYLIQNELKILYLTLKENIILGKKVGCTNLLAQSQINVFEPFYGNLFSKFSNTTGCKLKSNQFYKPFIEPEISFRIKKDININEAPFSIENSNDIFDFMFPSIEIVDFRFGNNIKEVGIHNLIATNGASEFYIKSDKLFSLNRINLENQKVKLFINDKIIAKGNTNLVLNNPLNSAIWLINKLSYIGEPMLKGQFITTGTCTEAISVKKNSFVKAHFGELGTVEFEYT